MKTFGAFLIFLRSLVKRPEAFRILWARTIDEAVAIGINSVFIVAVVSTFIGAVTCVQISYNLNNAFIPRSTIGFMVREMVILELAPTITSIVLAGKVGSSIASQLGTMRISEQIDALEVMGINPSSYLVFPKLTASLFVFPMLVILSMFLSIGGGYVAGTLSNALTGQEYITGLRDGFIPYNVVFALIKSVVFAFLISSISSYNGFFTSGGSLEVGNSSTAAVTNSIIGVLVADYVCAQLLL